MKRREFLQAVSVGAVTLFLSGCGLTALSVDEKKAPAEIPAKGSVSG